MPFFTVKSGFSLGHGVDAFPGDVLERDEKWGRMQMHRDYVRPSTPAEIERELGLRAEKAKEEAARAQAAAEAGPEGEGDEDEPADLDGHREAGEPGTIDNHDPDVTHRGPRPGRSRGGS